MKKITKHGIKRLKQRNKNQCRNGIANIAKSVEKLKDILMENSMNIY